MDDRGPIEVLPLTEDRFADLEPLFATGDPKWCWCTSFRRTGTEWRGSTPEGNRELLRDLAADDPAPGLVAYRDGAAIGWVSLAPREDYARLRASKVLAPVDDRPVWAIVCFVVARRARGQGVATVLLDAAVAYAKAHGATVLEAYPEDTDASPESLSAAVLYKGTMSMFERAGFEVVARRQWNAATRVRPIVRLELDAT
jgi:GNAT superfamily N-acetyltransferase